LNPCLLLSIKDHFLLFSFNHGFLVVGTKAGARVLFFLFF